VLRITANLLPDTWLKINYLPIASIRLTLPMSASDTIEVCPKLRLRLVDIFVKMWLLYAFFLAILPVPVSEKRFLALELVFIFGITCFYLCNLFIS